MDPEKTAPFELGSGEDACLLLHGFTGSPWDVRPVGERLAARGMFVRAIRLPGHGTTPEAMTAVSHRDWEQAGEDALRSLSSYRNVFVAGLSVGALCTLFGAKAVELIADGRFGEMVAHTGTSVEGVPLADAVGELRRVPLNGGYVHAARALGISMGD